LHGEKETLRLLQKEARAGEKLSIPLRRAQGIEKQTSTHSELRQRKERSKIREIGSTDPVHQRKKGSSFGNPLPPK